MLGQNIKKYRQNKGYTQEEVADRLHVTRQTVSKWEKNYSVPDAEMLVKLSEVLEVETYQLLGGNGPENAPEKQDAYAEQLAHIAEQMAVKNRTTKRVWKTVGIVVAAVVLAAVINLILLFVGLSAYSFEPADYAETHNETFIIEE